MSRLTTTENLWQIWVVGDLGYTCANNVRDPHITYHQQCSRGQKQTNMIP